MVTLQTKIQSQCYNEVYTEHPLVVHSRAYTRWVWNRGCTDCKREGEKERMLAASSSFGFVCVEANKHMQAQYSKTAYTDCHPYGHYPFQCIRWLATDQQIGSPRTNTNTRAEWRMSWACIEINPLVRLCELVSDCLHFSCSLNYDIVSMYMIIHNTFTWWHQNVSTLSRSPHTRTCSAVPKPWLPIYMCAHPIIQHSQRAQWRWSTCVRASATCCPTNIEQKSSERGNKLWERGNKLCE